MNIANTTRAKSTNISPALVATFVLFLSLFTFFQSCKGPQQIQFKEAEVTFLTLDQAVALNKKAPRKILINMYTDWCGWCKKMDQETFTHPDIISYINENYYAVKFNGELNEFVTFKGRTYGFIQEGKKSYNQLTKEFLGDKMTYPALVFLDEKLNLIQGLGGYQKPEALEVILHYFGNNEHKKTPWEDYKNNYKKEEANQVETKE